MKICARLLREAKGCYKEQKPCTAKRRIGAFASFCFDEVDKLPTSSMYNPKELDSAAWDFVPRGVIDSSQG